MDPRLKLSAWKSEKRGKHLYMKTVLEDYVARMFLFTFWVIKKKKKTKILNRYRAPIIYIAHRVYHNKLSERLYYRDSGRKSLQKY